MAPRRGTLVIVSGPTGVGKTTVCDRLVERPGFARSISATTRAPRPGETDGVHYQFMNKAAFLRARDEGIFLEWAIVHGENYYGTPRVPVEEKLERGTNVVLNIDVQGFDLVRRALPCVGFFLLPPSMDELRARIRNRGDRDQADIERRLRTAEAELARKGEYDHCIVNDVVDRTVDEIVRLLEERAR